MKNIEFDKFKEGLAGVYGFYDKQINQFSLDVWWNALKHFDLDEVTKAFNRHLVNVDTGKWLPKPADIIKMLQGSTQDSAMSAWSKVDKAIRNKGTYVDIVFDDPLIHRVINDMGGWIQLGHKNEDEWPFVAKEFENRYRGFKQRSEIPDYPSRLVGIANSHNSNKGFRLEPCVYVGDLEKCLLVESKGSGNAQITFTNESIIKREIKNTVNSLTFDKQKKTA